MKCEDGWLVIQNRFVHDKSFNRLWVEYVDGFGSFDEDFWWGLEPMYVLTSKNQYKLKIEFTTLGPSTYFYQIYDSFAVGADTTKYALSISSTSNGTAGESLYVMNGAKFGTTDKPHDQTTSAACGTLFQTGWWFTNCFGLGNTASLNGVHQSCTSPSNNGMICIFWRVMEDANSNQVSLDDTKMMIRPA